MSDWAGFNPATDHYVRGFAETLPTEGDVHAIIFDGRPRLEQIVAAWWNEGSAPDPHFGGRRSLSLITRPVT